jgi:hypothetical protein
MKKLIVGMDLQREYASFSYLDEEEKDVVDVKQGEDVLHIDNSLFFLNEDQSWHVGEDAMQLYVTRSGVMYDKILEHLGERSVLVIAGQEYDYTDLFCILLKMQLEQAFGSVTALDKLVISSPAADAVMNHAVHRFSQFLHLDEEQIELVSPTIANLFYIFQQDGNVWNNGVAVLCYDKCGMQLERIGVKRYQRPMHIRVTREKIDEMPPITAEAQDKDQALVQVCKAHLTGRERNVSGVFLVGEGFAQNWLDASAQLLCRGRRVFVCDNLYAKGAGYAAASGSAAISTDDSVYVEAPGMIHYDIGVKVMYEGREQIAPIVLGEREWFNIDGNASIFLDDTNRIEIAMYHRGTRQLEQEVIEIRGLPQRPPKTTKLNIRVRYLDARRGEICIRDKGFGTMYPTTGKVYRKEFELPEEG